MAKADVVLSEELVRAVRKVGNAITDGGASPGPDDTGGQVGCLTEAVMGMTSALVKIADSIHDLAEAVREHQE